MIPENFCINPEIFTVPEKNGSKTFRKKEITAFESRPSGTYVKSIHKNDCTICEISLTTLAEALAPEGFFRIHNTCVVNTFYIKMLDRTADKQLTMWDNTTYHVSRGHIRDLEEVMLQRYHHFMKMGTNRGMKRTRFCSNATIRGILAHPLWIALYLWRILYETTPTDSFLL
jgi:hypothetical protein